MATAELDWVLCCGGREITDMQTVCNTLMHLRKVMGEFRVLVGGARGADTWAVVTARMHNWQFHEEKVTPQEWEWFGPSAGNRRNTRMLEMRPVLVVAFWDGQSTGTLDTISKAVNVYRIPVLIVRCR